MKRRLVGRALGRVSAYLSVAAVGIGFVAGITRGEGGHVPYRNAGVESWMPRIVAGGHVLTFMPEKVHMSAVSHALSVEFVGAGVRPVACPGRGVHSWEGGGRVEYRDLWPGITVRYDRANKGIIESTYIINPGADLSRIRLKYNLPVILEDDGSLRFVTAEGILTETAPAAWQEINGKRVDVKVDFRVFSGRQIGFWTEPYDQRYALLIDPVYAFSPAASPSSRGNQ